MYMNMYIYLFISMFLLAPFDSLHSFPEWPLVSLQHPGGREKQWQFV